MLSCSTELFSGRHSSRHFTLQYSTYVRNTITARQIKPTNKKLNTTKHNEGITVVPRAIQFFIHSVVGVLKNVCSFFVFGLECVAAFRVRLYMWIPRGNCSSARTITGTTHDERNPTRSLKVSSEVRKTRTTEQGHRTDECVTSRLKKHGQTAFAFSLFVGVVLIVSIGNAGVQVWSVGPTLLGCRHTRVSENCVESNGR